ncbi:MAG TPA: LysE family transporter [Nitrososphaeraceae archaeon]|jgi:threonine/homoserine/homoserine lactone efflux protein|nr:LysE family transporter [Nitrososphaeraceae archaeon]
MDLLGFGAQIVFTSASGVISPGPLFFANLVYGSKQGIYSGIKMAYGHTIVELPLIIILASGLSAFSSITTSNLVSKLISLSGGIVILVFSAVQIVAFLKKKNGEKNIYFNTDNKKDPFIIGCILSALNPFFILWWLTAGLKLISDSLELYGFAMGIIVVFSFHIWMDYSWLAVTAHLISRGTLIFRSKYYPILLLALNAALIYYGIYFIVTGLIVS